MPLEKSGPDRQRRVGRLRHGWQWTKSTGGEQANLFRVRGAGALLLAANKGGAFPESFACSWRNHARPSTFLAVEKSPF